MLNTLTTSGRVLDLQIQGTLEDEDIHAYQAQLLSRLVQPGRFSVCVDLTGLHDIAPEAWAPGMRADLALLNQRERVDKIALVADKQWPAALAALAGHLLPGTEVRAFMDKAEASGWCETPVHPLPAAGGVVSLNTNRPDVLAFEVDGEIRGDGLDRTLEQLKEAVQRFDKIRLLARIRRFDGMDLGAAMQQDLLAFMFGALGKVERYALVGGPRWIQRMATAVGPMVPGLHIRCFASENEAAAWHWLEARKMQ